MTLEDDVLTNTGNIATNTLNISTNANNINTLTTNSGTETLNIITNANNIASNTALINNNIADIDKNEGYIITNTANIAINATDISSNLTSINTNATNISSNLTSINTNATNISSNLTSINANTGNISSNLTSINANTGNISSNLTSINANTANISSNLTSINANTANISSNLTTINANVQAIDAIEVKTDPIEIVTASSYYTRLQWAFKNLTTGTNVGYIGPVGDQLFIGVEGSNSLVLNPSSGMVQNYCEKTLFGDNLGSGKIILTGSTPSDLNSITINNEVQYKAFTNAIYDQIYSHNKFNLVSTPNWGFVNRTTPYVNSYFANNSTLYDALSAPEFSSLTTQPGVLYVWNVGETRIHIKYSLNFQSNSSVIRTYKSKIQVHNSSAVLLYDSLYEGLEFNGTGLDHYNFINYSDSLIATINNGDTITIHTIYDFNTPSSGGFDMLSKVTITEL